MGMERRLSKRFDVSGDYLFYPEKTNNRIICKLDNISITGACILTEAKIKIDDVIQLHIRGAQDKFLKSKVVWKIDNQFGLLFMLDTEEEFNNISFIMNNVLKESFVES